MKPVARALSSVALGLLVWAALPQPAAATDAGTPLEDPGPGLIDRHDPWEPMNRGIYRFNSNFDRRVWVPVLRGYRFVFPPIVRRGFSNFFANLDQITIFGNSVLQLSPRKTAGTLGRFVVNTTVGIGGLLDPASRFGLFSYNEDFGQTLGHYGMGPGPYLMLPILGPSSLRDTAGTIVDTAAVAALQHFAFGNPISDRPYLYSIYVLQAIQLRDDTPFHFGELGPFEYELVRLFYLEHRRLLVEQ